jgi:LCP family protein required for cell wall assembly
MSRNGKRKSTTKIIIFMVELIVVALLGVACYVVVRAFGTDPEKEGVTVVKLQEEKLEIAEEVKENETMKGYMNVALFGVDISREKKSDSGTTVSLLPANDLRKSGLLKGFRSDTIMIASINMDTGDIKLVSVFRDTFLNTGDTYSKCNAAYSKGGAEAAVKMLNTNLDLNIENFVTVSYWALVGLIDELGGVEIDVDSKELVHLNNYGICIGQFGIGNDSRIVTLCHVRIHANCNGSHLTIVTIKSIELTCLWILGHGSAEHFNSTVIQYCIAERRSLLTRRALVAQASSADTIYSKSFRQLQTELETSYRVGILHLNRERLLQTYTNAGRLYIDSIIHRADVSVGSRTSGLGMMWITIVNTPEDNVGNT